jgi:hypothetical protein
MVAPGRNDPCPCGSGQKFKRCCGDGAAAVSPSYTDAEQVSGLNKLVRFSLRAEFRELRIVAETEFWTPHAAKIAPEELERLCAIEMVQINFNCFFMLEFALDLDVPGEPTLVDRLLARAGHELSGAERRFLEDLRAAPVTPYEVVEVEPGEGMRLRNLWVPGDVWVTEHTASQSLRVWEILATRVLRRPEGGHVLHGSLFPFPADCKQPILERLEREHRERLAETPALTPEAFLRRLSRCYHGLWLESGPLRKAPSLATFDGEPLQPTELRFRVRDVSALHAALDKEPEVWDGTEDGWILGRMVGSFHHVVGWLKLSGDGLVLTAMAEKHAAEVRAHLERSAGSLVLHEETRIRSVEEMARERGRDAPSPPPRRTKEMRQLQFRAMDEYYRRWLDEKIPALDGRTPRESARDERFRPRLVQLLKEIENQEERNKADGASPYNFDRVWSWLRLERPGGPSRRSRYPYFVADMRHYLDEGGFSGRMPREMRMLGLYLGRIVSRGAHAESNVSLHSDLDCRRRPERVPCAGKLVIRREADTDRILWACPACEDGGTIHGWAGTAFDPGARTRDPARAGELVRERITLDRNLFRTLERIDRLSKRALALVVQVEDVNGRAMLDGERSEFAELHECILAARAHQPGPAEARALGLLEAVVGIAAADSRR